MQKIKLPGQHERFQTGGAVHTSGSPYALRYSSMLVHPHWSSRHEASTSTLHSFARAIRVGLRTTMAAAAAAGAAGADSNAADDTDGDEDDDANMNFDFSLPPPTDTTPAFATEPPMLALALGAIENEAALPCIASMMARRSNSSLPPPDM